MELCAELSQNTRRDETVCDVHHGQQLRQHAVYRFDQHPRKANRRHQAGVGSAFTARYRTNRLVYYELTEDLQTARERERQVKGWVRRKKIALIAQANPKWRDLSETLGE